MDLFDFLCVDVYLPGQSSCKILALYSQRSPRYVRFCFLRRVNPSAGPKVKIHLKPLKKVHTWLQNLCLGATFVWRVHFLTRNWLIKWHVNSCLVIVWPYGQNKLELTWLKLLLHYIFNSQFSLGRHIYMIYCPENHLQRATFINLQILALTNKPWNCVTLRTKIPQ